MTDHLREVPLRDLLTQVTRNVSVASKAEIPFAGVRWYAEGVYQRAVQPAAQVKARTLNEVEQGDVTYNRMWATKAAFGVAGADVAGCLVTSDFPLFSASEDVLPGYLRLVFQTPDFQATAAGLAVGTTERRRLKEADFLAILIRLPPAATQRRVVDLMTHLDQHIARLHDEHDAAHTLLLSARRALISKDGEGTCAERLGDVVESLDSRRRPVKSDDRKAGPYPYFGASGVVDHVDEWLFEGEALLVSEDGANLRLRSTPIAFCVEGRYWVNNHAHVLRAVYPHSNRYLAHVIEATDIELALTGTTMPKLNARNLLQIRVALPEASEQVKIAATLDSVSDLCSSIEDEIESIKGLRLGLLKVLLAAEIDVPTSYDTLLDAGL